MFYQQGLVARSPAAHVSADTTCTTTMQREHAASCTSQRPKQEQVRNLAVFFSIFHWSTSGRALGTLQHTADTHICFSQTLSAVICWKVLAARWQPGAEPISPSGVLGAVSLVPPAKFPPSCTVVSQKKWILTTQWTKPAGKAPQVSGTHGAPGSTAATPQGQLLALVLNVQCAVPRGSTHISQDNQAFRINLQSFLP